MATSRLSLKMGVPLLLLLLLLWMLVPVGDDTVGDWLLVLPDQQGLHRTSNLLLLKQVSPTLGTTEQDQTLSQPKHTTTHSMTTTTTITTAEGENEQDKTAKSLQFHHQNLEEPNRSTSKTSSTHPSGGMLQMKAAKVTMAAFERKLTRRIGHVNAPHDRRYGRRVGREVRQETSESWDTSVTSSALSSFSSLPEGEVTSTPLTTSLKPVDTHPQQQGENNVDDRQNNKPVKSVTILCDHPPHEFTLAYKGQSYDTCKSKIDDNTKVIKYNETESLCDVLYEQTESSSTVLLYLSHNYHVYLGKYAALCAPLYDSFHNCTGNAFLTVCNDTGKVFINPDTCPGVRVVAEMDILLDNYFEGNVSCMWEACNGGFYAIQDTINEVQVILTRVPRKCSSFPIVVPSFGESWYSLQNHQWPCCYPHYLVLWSDVPEKHGLNGGWSYLPWKCMVGEVCLVVMVGCVAVSGVIGNLLVMVVMLMGQHGGGESSRLRTSLAVADLAKALFVVCPSLYYHILPFITTPDYDVASEEIILLYPYDSTTLLASGLPLLQALLVCVCSIVSIETTFLLSIERLILTTRALKYRHYITVPIVNGVIGFTWIMALLDTFLFTYNGSETLIDAEWTRFAKLPLGHSINRINTLVFTIYFIHYILLLIVCFSTLVFSVLAIISFKRQQARLKAEWEALKMKYSGPMKKENRHILITQVLITFFFLVSVLPYGVVFILGEAKAKTKNAEIITYVAYWSFMANVAWNPWIYNIRSQNFREDIASIWQKKFTK